MKKLSISMLLLAAIALTVPSCKKGEEDPGLSLKSRAGRLAGEWDVTAYERVQKETDEGETETYTTTHSGSGDQITTMTTTENTDVFRDTVSIVTHSITFDKEGTYTMVLTTNRVFEGFGVKEVTDITETISGNWQFLGKSGDYKNKERIALTETSAETKTHFVRTLDGNPDKDITTTDMDNSTMTNVAVTFDIIRLSGEEIILESNRDSDQTQTTNTPGSTPETYNTSTTEKYTLTAAGE